MNATNNKRALTGKDVITVGIFSAVYFVINFIFMLLGGFHPMLWILMPGLIAVFTGIPYLMMCAKVQKPGSVLLMGLITGLIYFVTGQFTVIILITFVISCVLAELTRRQTKYRGSKGNMLSFVFFSLGMTGSPLPIWIMRDSFLAQITEQGMPADYIATLKAVSSPVMLVVMVVAPIVGALIGAAIARTMFNKHFIKAGIV
ncbi:MptD family putative ECF transporter S component [Lacrimispora sp. NSJ-141]|uniref:MptD family putative ECF transporter S component n=1 Tax=Lientehia hominis TaxID=2897778 RepID=A0AAP2W819_9FIRM|nr:MptD family putative ECF transporter S component [Lientehia hominis]MCD2491576.1 MptD family putative ECF transporter S component [Lientehia hominis]